jgi:serine/threonine-protein kinase SRPK3
MIAVKILTAAATAQNRAGQLHELATLQAVAEIAKTIHPPAKLPILLDHFEIQGPHGDHLCFVVDARSTSVDDFRRSAPSKTLRLHVVQLFMFHVLLGLEVLHRAAIIHTGKFNYFCTRV